MFHVIHALPVPVAFDKNNFKEICYCRDIKQI